MVNRLDESPDVTSDAPGLPADESIAAAGEGVAKAGVVNDVGCPEELLEAIKAIQARGIRLVACGSRMPGAIGEDGRGAWKFLTPEEQAVFRRHRDALKDIVKRGALPVSRPPEPAPEVEQPITRTPAPKPQEP